ncbi:hypothetical protein [Halalkalibacter sp. APA_J-10(15)]|uniref:hypothetical protein n=1 Tax=Halalkalibacter sp. APA_J-10(15) TaxID=2933805 RepID=UPI001FF5C37B|nr:hypothetical protein [Halalkalibacter sp. APA_J-10(15)]MCK0470869.1 hypothetical protein [Halalkalibacter sp. APA_J-10(15)]
MRKSDREYRVSEMNYAELDDLIFKKSRNANDQLFGGLLSMFNRLYDENELIIKELDYIKAYLQNQEKPIVEPNSKEEIEEDIKEDIEVNKMKSYPTAEEVYEEPSEEDIEAVKRYLQKEERDRQRSKKKYTPKLKMKSALYE